MTDDAKTRILVVDDHPVSARGLSLVLNGEPDMEVCGLAASPAEAMRLFATLKPDMAIVDLQMGHLSGLDLVKDMLAQRSDFCILIFSMHEESLYAERAIRAGARGYVMKQEPATTLIAAVRTLRAGRIHLREGLAPHLLALRLGAKPMGPTALLDQLSDRELQIMEAMGDGKGRKQIADEVHLSIKTIDGLRRGIVRKLDLRNTTELAQFAVQMKERGEL